MTQQNISPINLTRKQKRLLISRYKLMLYIDAVFESIYTTILSNVQKYLAKGYGCIVNSVIVRLISTSKYNPLAASIYIILPKELDHPKNV